MTVDADKDLASIGTLAAQFRVTVRAVENACIELGLGGGWRLNGVRYLDGQQQERLAEHFRQGTTVGTPR